MGSSSQALGISHSSSQEGFGQRRSTLVSNRAEGGGGHTQNGLLSAIRGDGGMYGRTPQTGRSVPNR